jgi:hypothetical protein
MATQEIGETINATNVVDGISPHWNEMIYVDVSEELNHSEGRTTYFIRWNVFSIDCVWVFRGYHIDY